MFAMPFVLSSVITLQQAARVYAMPGLGADPEPGLLIFDGEMLKYLRVKQQESGLATGSK